MHTKREQIVIDKYISIIQGHFPNIDSQKIKLFREGYDHDVLLVDTQAFRFPRSKSYENKDRVENVFLSIFTKISPISVQSMVAKTDQKTGIEYQTYQFIPGIQLSKKVAQTLSEQEIIHISTKMGKFLKQLHSFGLTEARSMKMDELDPNTYWKYFEDLYTKIKTTTFPLLSENEQQWIEELAKDYIDITKNNSFELKVTHHDLLAEHIIIDQATHTLNGVIDFSLRIADPAVDFAYFDRYGDTFLQTTYKNYLPVDKYFDMRRKFYAAHVPIINLYESIERNDLVMKEKYLIELKEYMLEAK